MNTEAKALATNSALGSPLSRVHAVLRPVLNQYRWRTTCQSPVSSNVVGTGSVQFGSNMIQFTPKASLHFASYLLGEVSPKDIIGLRVGKVTGLAVFQLAATFDPRS